MRWRKRLLSMPAATAPLVLLAACSLKALDRPPGTYIDPRTANVPGYYRSPDGAYSFRYPETWQIGADGDETQASDALILTSFKPGTSPRTDSGYEQIDGEFKIDVTFERGGSSDPPADIIRETCVGNSDLSQGPPVEVVSCRTEHIDGSLVAWMVLDEEYTREIIVIGRIGDVAVSAIAFLPPGDSRDLGESTAGAILRSIRSPAEPA